ncbi:MAG: DUF883 C-terminal domain-containing protein [bacterium]|nr:DUF883 C-terminal domain-containing protein [bacterium]
MARSAEPKEKAGSTNFRDKAAAIGHNVQEIGRISREVAHDTMDVLKENAGEYYHQGVERAKSVEQNLEGKIRDNPIQSLLIAIGLGFLVGMLFRRR